MEESIKNISEGVKWYRNNSDRATIGKLLNFQDKMACESYYISEILARHHRQFTDAYRVRKWTYNKAKVSFMKEESMSGIKAEAEAFSKVEDLKKVEDLNYNIGYELDNIIKGVDKILKACQQRISFLKMEYEQTKRQNNT